VYTAYHGTENRVTEVCVLVPSCRVLLPSPLRLSSAEYTNKRANNSGDRPTKKQDDDKTMTKTFATEMSPAPPRPLSTTALECFNCQKRQFFTFVFSLRFTARVVVFEVRRIFHTDLAELLLSVSSPTPSQASRCGSPLLAPLQIFNPFYNLNCSAQERAP
jgi:hypothetical protein